jgi:hypothetical protein
MAMQFKTDASGKVLPDDEDFLRIEKTPKYAGCSDAEKYRLAQANKLIRLYERGLLPKDARSARRKRK